MGFWVFLVVFVLLMLLFKAYIIRGVYQALLSKRSMYIFGTISVASLVIGIIVMLVVFPSDPIRMNPWVNLVIAFMMSVLCCEAILSIFFILDDLVIGGKRVFHFFQKKEDEEKPIEKTKGRRRFLKLAGIGFTAIPFASYIYGITKGKYSYKIFREQITFKNLPDAFDGFKIIQFSDFHSGSFDNLKAVKKGIQAIQNVGADLILFTGDLVNDRSDEVLPYKEALGNLSAPFGKYSILGNHDYYGMNEHRRGPRNSIEEGLAPILQHHADMGFTLLKNEHTLIEKDGQQFSLLGVENWGSSFAKLGDLDKALTNCPDENFTLLLSHDPTHWEEKVKDHRRQIDLTLSGHTHGMQMGVEIGRIKWSPVQYIYKHWAGLYKEKNQYLYVNRGFGFLGFAGRVGIPPEITLIELKKG